MKQELDKLERKYTLLYNRMDSWPTIGGMASDQLGSARANLGCVVRAGKSYQGKQGLNYTPGISAQSAGSQAIWLGSWTLSTWRTKAHLHENHETAIYFISGDEVELWTGEQLEQGGRPPRRLLVHPGGSAPCGGQSQRDASHLRFGAD